jgi:hypothetical protein
MGSNADIGKLWHDVFMSSRPSHVNPKFAVTRA